MKRIRTKTVLALVTVVAIYASFDHLVAGETNTSAISSRRTNEAEVIPWSRLAPENGKPFTDPFAQLSSDQLMDLSYVVRVRRLIADKKIGSNGEDAKVAAELARKLKQQGVDIGWLMVQRERVRQIRGLQVESLSKSIASSLQDKRVSLIGYVIPIKAKERRLTEFFLVPTIAACSHEDAPPRLQAVFVSTEQGIAPPDKRTPVRVTGKVAAETTTRTTFNGNGRVKVHSAYRISSPEIEIFQAIRKASGSPQR